MKPLHYIPMEKTHIEDINRRHIHSVDKLYRMHGGLSSKLLDFNNGTIYTQIHTTDLWTKSPLLTAFQLVQCWVDFNPELNTAWKFHVSFYSSEPGKTMNAAEVIEGVLMCEN